MTQSASTIRDPNPVIAYAREFLKDRTGEDFRQEALSFLEALDDSVGYTPDQIDHARAVLSRLVSVTPMIPTGVYDPMLLTSTFATEEFGIPNLHGELADLYADVETTLQTLTGSGVAPAPLAPIPLDQIAGVAQKTLRRDALDWYIEHGPEGMTFDDQRSFFGFDGPLAIRTPRGYVIVDGCHRFAASLLAGATHLLAHAVEPLPPLKETSPS